MFIPIEIRPAKDENVWSPHHNWFWYFFTTHVDQEIAPVEFSRMRSGTLGEETKAWVDHLNDTEIHHWKG